MRLIKPLLAALVLFGLLVSVAPEQATAASGRTLYVAPWGSDYLPDGWSEQPNSASTPWETIYIAIRRAEPGDTIVVRGGTYVENIGWGAKAASASQPITMKPYGDEVVTVKGTLQLDGADYWTVDGIRFIDNTSQARREFVVSFNGGTGWQLLNSEISGGRGVSNLMIIGDNGHGLPSNYRVANNCIHDNNSTDTALMNNHNIYLMPGYGAGPGVIERNIVFNAANGANIKAAGGDTTRIATNATIRYNTLSNAGAGVILGYDTNNVTMERNLFGPQQGGTESYNAAIIGNHLAGAGNVAKDNAVFGFPSFYRETDDSTATVAASGTQWVSPDYDSYTCGGFVPSNAQAQSFGRYGGDTEPSPPSSGDRFVDDDGSVFEADIEWIAAREITKGCNPPINNRYCPDSNVTRGTMAAFLRRALELPGTTTDYFTDDDGTVFEDDINALAAAGVTKGCNPPANTRFCPDSTMGRGAMAAFLQRAFDLPRTSVDYFDDDDGSVFEKDINAIAAAGISMGCNPPTNSRYCVDRGVSRGSMAAFLHRALD